MCTAIEFRVSFVADKCRPLRHKYVINGRIEREPAIGNDNRWMIRGVDRKIRKAVKDAAKTEGTSVGTWVRRALLRALDTTADSPATLVDLSERMRVLAARLSVLEKSHRNLHQSVHASEDLIGKSESEKRNRWPRTRKSK
jgi:hypothetical protein